MFHIVILVLLNGQPQTTITSKHGYLSLYDCNIAMFNGIKDIKPKPGVSFRMRCEDHT